ncbi:MAG: NUDIX hydrolase [Myxococcota bacterium]|nr:NUDIX hydrolase [Myxococcota bacterium]
MSARDAVWRAGLRVAWLGLRTWWWVRRPEVRGAAVVVRVEDRILLVRNAYQPRLTLPGGRVRRGEAPAAAAARELREEVGIDVSPARLRPLVDRVFRWGHIRNRVALFELRLAAPPRIAPDRREVVAAHFLTEEEARRERLWPPLARWLGERHATPGRDPARGETEDRT